MGQEPLALHYSGGHPIDVGLEIHGGDEQDLGQGLAHRPDGNRNDHEADQRQYDRVHVWRDPAKRRSAGRLSDQVGVRIAEARRELGAKVIRQYCLAKGIAVALNPIPVADLLAAATLDAALVMHLGRVYGLPLTRGEAGSLIAVISAQLAALMGAIWGVHLVASALKGVSAGLSTVVTAGAQGALAWYATELVGRAAERYLIAGKSWGEKGPKRVVAEIVESLDRDSILREAREEILRRLREKRAGV